MDHSAETELSRERRWCCMNCWNVVGSVLTDSTEPRIVRSGVSRSHSFRSVVDEKTSCWALCAGNITSEKEVWQYECEGIHS